MNGDTAIPLYLAAGLAVVMLAGRYLAWRYRLRRINRRRARRGGYVEFPIFDDQWDPRK